MALPGNNPNAIVDAVAAEIKAMDTKGLAELPDLQDDDFQVFGQLIQGFAYIDFNLRRALAIFHEAGMLPEQYKKLYPGLPDAKLTEAVGEIIKGIDPKAEDLETARVWLQVIDETRKKRNLVGHFAGRRHPKQDVYVFVSNSDKDARKFFGFGLAEGEVHTVVAARPEFAEMVESAKKASLWLGRKVAEWNARYRGGKPSMSA